MGSGGEPQSAQRKEFVMTKRKEGFYWLKSERSSDVGIGQWLEKKWYLINEEGPVTEIELKRRGWKAGNYVERYVWAKAA
jgi:hypothetical protein